MSLANLWASQVNPQWLAETKAGLNAAYPGFDRAMEAVQSKFMLDHFMGADAPKCLIGSLPDIAGQNVLQGTHFVQIEEAFDASRPIKDRYTDLNSPGRVLKLHLSDGKRSIVAIEHQFIPDLSHGLSRGCKAILEGPIRVESGSLLLVPGNIWVIGGAVKELDAQMRALSDAVMQQPVGRRGPQPTLEQFLNTLIHQVISDAGAAAVRNNNGDGAGVTQGGGPAQPVSPEQQQQHALQQPQRAPDSPRQLPQQQQQQEQHLPVPTDNGNAVNNGYVAVNQHVASAIQQQQYGGSISFGSGYVPPISGGAGTGASGGIQQQQQQQQQQQLPNPRLPRATSNGTHAPASHQLDRISGGGGEGYRGAATSDEGWPSQSQDEEEENEEETQPEFPNGQLQIHNNNTRTALGVDDSPGREDDDGDDPIILLGSSAPSTNGNTIGNTTDNNGTPPRVPAAATAAATVRGAAHNDDIESSSQEDGHREMSMPYKSSSGKKNKRKSGDLRRSASPQIMVVRMNGNNVSPTEPQEHFLRGEDGDGDGDGGGNSSETRKKQRLESCGKSNTTTNIVVNAGMGAAEPSPWARAALFRDCNQVLAVAPPRSHPIDDLLMAPPPGLDQIRAEAAVVPPLLFQHQQQQEQQALDNNNNNVVDTSIREWGSQGPQPYTYLYHLAQHISAVESWHQDHPQQDFSTYYPISATVHGSIRITEAGQKRRLNLKVVVEDATGTVQAVLNEGMVLDHINSILREITGGNGGIQLDTVGDFFRLRRENEALFRDAIGRFKILVNMHYGLMELMVRAGGGDNGLGELPEVVLLLDASLTSSQIEMLRARVQGHSGHRRGGGGH